MTDNLQQQATTNTKINNINKRLTLIKITKVDLSNENDDHENIEYSPAYITTTNTYVTNNGTLSPDVHFQLLGMFNCFHH